MATILAALGDARFEVSNVNYHELERVFNYRWQPQERLGRRTAQQFMGPGEETLSLRGTIYPKMPQFAGSLGKLENMRSKAATGAAFNFAAVFGGKGRNFGRFCVRAIRDQQSYFDPDGTPRKVEFDIELVAYGGDAGGGFSLF